MKQAVQKKYLTPPVESLIRVIRGQKVILDHDLADLYGVTTRTLNQSVRRNLERFPDDFMFRLSIKEAENSRSPNTAKKTVKNHIVSNLRSQIVTSSSGYGGRRYLPYAFIEHGIAMLSSVLHSPRAIQVNILIVRAFVRLRELIATNKEFAARLDKLERGHERVDSIIEVLIEDIGKLGKEIHWIKNPPLPKKHRLGFFVDKESAND